MICVLVMLSTVPLFMAVGKNFLPQDDQSEFEVTVRMPPGSSLEGSAEVMTQLENELKTLPGVRNLLTTLGADHAEAGRPRIDPGRSRRRQAAQGDADRRSCSWRASG